MRTLIVVIALMPAIFGCSQNTQKATETNSSIETLDNKVTTESADYIFDGKIITKPDSVWQKELNGMTYYVMRQAGTERPFQNAYYDNHEKGIYYCAACGLPLFSSETKFDSGTGWPSYYTPINDLNIGKDTDLVIGYVRTEVHCARCDGHLGHVFDDAPQTPTGLRYCINSASLVFKKQ